MQYSTHLLRHLRLSIGRNIHARRVSQKITLHKLARLSHVPLEQLDLYELGKGEVRLDELLRLACVLGTTPEALVSIKP